MNSKAYLQISFAWLFAIVVGAVILFLAIYLASKIINTEETISDAKTSKEIGVLLNPLETGFESSKSTSISFPAETRIYNKCNNRGNLGRQIIQVSQKNFNKWSETNIDVGFSNKYIFSQDFTEGKNFYILSKPFEFPFKVTDLMIITSSKIDYCFTNAPEEISEELMILNQGNIMLENCTSESIKVCFKGGNCEVKVDYDLKRITKDGEVMFFTSDALMYAGIFSSKDVYECQIKRLMQRVDNLALLYKDKATYVAQKNCESNLDLLTLSNLANSFENSQELFVVSNVAEAIGEENELGDCKLW